MNKYKTIMALLFFSVVSMAQQKQYVSRNNNSPSQCVLNLAWSELQNRQPEIKILNMHVELYESESDLAHIGQNEALYKLTGKIMNVKNNKIARIAGALNVMLTNEVVALNGFKTTCQLNIGFFIQSNFEIYTLKENSQIIDEKIY